MDIDFMRFFTLLELLRLLKKSNKISQETVDMVHASCEQTNKFYPITLRSKL